MAAYGHVTTVLVRDGRRLARIVPEEDAWVYSPAWQDKLREAEADLAAGRVQRFEDDDEFLGHLDALADEAGGCSLRSQCRRGAGAAGRVREGRRHPGRTTTSA
jgi:hypothetical protein